VDAVVEEPVEALVEEAILQTGALVETKLSLPVLHPPTQAASSAIGVVIMPALVELHHCRPMLQREPLVTPFATLRINASLQCRHLKSHEQIFPVHPPKVITIQTEITAGLL
jgi:hypothetical protein